MYVAMVPTCLSVSICPPLPQPLPDRYADYGYRVNSHLRRVKKRRKIKIKVYTKRTRDTPPPTPIMASHFLLLTVISVSLSLSLSLFATHPGTSPSHDPFSCTFEAVSVQRPFIQNNITRECVIFL